MAVPSREVGARYCAPVLTKQEVFSNGGGVSFFPVKIDCHVHRRVVAGLTGGDADDLLGEPALIPLRVHP